MSANSNPYSPPGCGLVGPIPNNTGKVAAIKALGTGPTLQTNEENHAGLVVASGGQLIPVSTAVAMGMLTWNGSVFVENRGPW